MRLMLPIESEKVDAILAPVPPLLGVLRAHVFPSKYLFRTLLITG
jgi:hypothetical protein